MDIGAAVGAKRALLQGVVAEHAAGFGESQPSQNGKWLVIRWVAAEDAYCGVLRSETCSELQSRVHVRKCGVWGRHFLYRRLFAMHCFCRACSNADEAGRTKRATTDASKRAGTLGQGGGRRFKQGCGGGTRAAGRGGLNVAAVRRRGR
jgi:hypothetical protein